MHEYAYRNLSSLTVTTSALLSAYAATNILATGLMAMSPTPLFAGHSFGLAEAASLVESILLFACFVVVGRWIYRASVNAHAMSDTMDVSPGWAVGWYFIPFANLVKPFQAMREIWHVSHGSSGGFRDGTPSIVGWWWALWLASNVLGNVAWRLDAKGDGTGLVPLYTVIALINVPLCFCLITMMREITRSQETTRHAAAFA